MIGVSFDGRFFKLLLLQSFLDHFDDRGLELGIEAVGDQKVMDELLPVGIFWHLDEIFLAADVDVDLQLYLLFRHFIIAYHTPMNNRKTHTYQCFRPNMQLAAADRKTKKIRRT